AAAPRTQALADAVPNRWLALVRPGGLAAGRVAAPPGPDRPAGRRDRGGLAAGAGCRLGRRLGGGSAAALGLRPAGPAPYPRGGRPRGPRPHRERPVPIRPPSVVRELSG